MDYNYHILGVNLIWWAILFVSLFLMFSFFFSVTRKRSKNSPLDVLHQKFSKGKISEHEYEKRKKFLQKEHDLKMRMFFLSSLSND